MIMENKKGISLSITAIVVIAVGLVVMLVVLGYFVGGFGQTGGAMQGVTADVESQANTSGMGAQVGGISGMWKKGAGGSCQYNEQCRAAYACNMSDSKCWLIAQ